MSRQVQIRRGTDAEHRDFIGAIGEITMDTTNRTLRVHDGKTPGGMRIATQSDAAPMPNYAGASEIGCPTYQNPYTATENCVCIAMAAGARFDNWHATVNGMQFLIGRGNNSEIVQSANIVLPLAAGDQIYFSAPGDGEYEYKIYIATTR